MGGKFGGEEKRVTVGKYIFSRGFETRLEETETDFTTTLARRNRKTTRGATVRAIFE